MIFNVFNKYTNYCYISFTTFNQSHVSFLQQQYICSHRCLLYVIEGREFDDADSDGEANKAFEGRTHSADTQTRRHTQTHTDTRRHTQTHADTRRHTQTHADTRRHTQTHADTRRHTQTHADTRRHTQTHTDTLSPAFHCSKSAHFCVIKQCFSVCLCTHISIFLCFTLIFILSRSPSHFHIICCCFLWHLPCTCSCVFPDTFWLAPLFSFVYISYCTSYIYSSLRNILCIAGYNYLMQC